jgi:hypothetical protein
LRRQQYDGNQQSKSEQWPLNDFCFHSGWILFWPSLAPRC